MTRLTNHLRNNIRRAAIADLFKKDKAEIQAKTDDLIERIYNSFVSKKERELLAKIDKVWLDYSNGFYVNAAAGMFNFHTSKDYPTKWRRGRIDLTDKKLIEEARTVATLRDKHAERIEQVKQSLQSMLNQTKTFKQLAKIWPEGKDYWEPVWSGEKSRALPAIDVKSVNHMLGLPKDKAA